MSCPPRTAASTSRPFEHTSKRRKGFPSEANVKRGERFVHGGEKELVEKLGRNDLCPCGSSRRFQEVLHGERRLRWHAETPLLSGSRRHGEVFRCRRRRVPRVGGARHRSRPSSSRDQRGRSASSRRRRGACSTMQCGRPCAARRRFRWGPYIGCQSSSRFPSRSLIQANRPKLSFIRSGSTQTPAAVSFARSASRSSTR